jgi:hypothetical protein
VLQQEAPRARRHKIRISAPDRVIMPPRTYRNGDRASAGSSRTPLARTVPILLSLFSLLARTTFAADSRWLPSIGDPADNACFQENKFGTTRIALCAYGVPTTTQIAFNAYNKTVNDLPAPKAWITIQDHSIALVKNTAAPGDKPEVWSKHQSYFASTNDGGSEFMGQTTSTWFGTKQGDENTGASAVRSAMSYGYTSYAPIDRCTETFGYTNETAATKTDAEIMSEKSITHEEVDLIRKHCNGTYDQKLRENQFMTMTGGGGGYWLNGCPNYSPGNTSKNMNYTCPAVPIAPGGYKFSILGMLYGSMINSAHTESYGGYGAEGLYDYQVPHSRDLAQYKSLVMTSTLDITNVGENTTVRSAWVEWRNGTTVNFTDISDTTNLAGTKLHFVSPGSGEDEIVLKFAPYYSTGKYERDVAAVKKEFGIPCQYPDHCPTCLDYCVRDITGYDGGFQSKALGREIKKLGNGGLSTLPTQHASKSSFYPGATSTPKSTKEELMSLGGAPKLEVTEVRPVKIFLRKHGGCTGRPASPAAADMSGENTWPNAPADCPNWFKASNHDGSKWLSEERGTAVKNEWMIDCEAGDLRCYLVDVHLDLAYLNGTRAVLGDITNDAGSDKYGWGKGTFFMYDPEIGTGDAVSGFGDEIQGSGDLPCPASGCLYPGPTPDSGSDSNLIFVFIGVAIGVVALVIGMVVYCLAVRKRKRLKVSGTKQVKAEV